MAESCTGGIISSLLTSLPGSSKYFMLGVVTYSNRAKNRILGIPAQLINKKGAVSCEVAINMAEKVRQIAKADYGIGATGIAGPAGGSAKKPVGTVFIAASCGNECICERFSFKGSRTSVRNQAALKALNLIYPLLK